MCTPVPPNEGRVPTSCGIPSLTLCKPTNTRNISCYLRRKNNQERRSIKKCTYEHEEYIMKRIYILKEMETKKDMLQGAGYTENNVDFCWYDQSNNAYSTGPPTSSASGPSLTPYNLMFLNYRYLYSSDSYIECGSSCIYNIYIRNQAKYLTYRLSVIPIQQRGSRPCQVSAFGFTMDNPQSW